MADLIVQHVSKSYPTPTEPLVVLRDVNLQLSRGESVAIVGPSGCGKSTLLQIIGTLDTPSAGSLTLDGTEPFSLPEPALAKFRNERIGFVFQGHHLLPQLTALENVLVPTLALGPTSSAQQSHALELLDRVGLAARNHHRPAELSGGERQRVAIARALMNQPLIVLADEPTGNLDPSTAADVTELLLQLQRSSSPATMLVVVTHSDDLSHRLQRRVRLDHGELSQVTE